MLEDSHLSPEENLQICSVWAKDTVNAQPQKLLWKTIGNLNQSRKKEKQFAKKYSERKAPRANRQENGGELFVSSLRSQVSS